MRDRKEKRPITVTRCQSGAEGKDYDLVCGQGRLEAFIECGQTEIPAVIIDVDEDHFNVLLRAEGLSTMPKQLVTLIDEKGKAHG